MAQGQEGSGADVQRDGFARDAMGCEGGEEVWGEVEAGGGGGDGAFVAGEDGLVVAGVGFGGAGGAGDVGGQGEGAGGVEGLGEGVAVEIEAQRDAAVFVAGGDGGGEGVAGVDGERVAGAEAAGVAGQRVPGAVGEGAIEGEADAGVAAAGGELGGDDAGVVGDQQVAGAEQRGQVADDAVVPAGGRDVEQASGVARAGRFVGDAFGRQIEVEIRGRERLSRGNRWRSR